MNPNTALIAAIVCTVGAVALVASDMAFNVEAKLEVRDASGNWREVAANGDNARPYAGPTTACGSEFKLTVHNGLPWATTQEFTITVTANGGRSTTVLDESWQMRAGDTRVHEFQVSNATFQSSPSPEPFQKGSASVQVDFGADYNRQLYANACPEATS